MGSLPAKWHVSSSIQVSIPFPGPVCTSTRHVCFRKCLQMKSNLTRSKSLGLMGSLHNRDLIELQSYSIRPNLYRSVQCRGEKDTISGNCSWSEKFLKKSTQTRTQMVVGKNKTCGVGLLHQIQNKFQYSTLPLIIRPWDASIDWLIDDFLQQKSFSWRKLKFPECFWQWMNMISKIQFGFRLAEFDPGKNFFRENHVWPIPKSIQRISIFDMKKILQQKNRQSINQSKHLMVECLTAVLDIGIVLNLMPQCDIARFIFLSNKLSSGLRGFILGIFWIQGHRPFLCKERKRIKVVFHATTDPIRFDKKITSE